MLWARDIGAGEVGMRTCKDRPLRIATGLLLLSCLAACSTERYGEPIEGFRDAAAQATDAVREMNETLADATLDYAVRSAADPTLGSLRLVEDADCGAYVPEATPETAVRCRALFEVKGENGVTVTIDRAQYTDPMGNMVAVMIAVQKYAANLAAVQSDDTAAEVNASIDKIQANLVELIKATDPDAQIPAGLPAAAGDGVKWVFGQYIESVKLDALQKATKAAVGPLDDAAFVFSEFAKTAKQQLSVTVMAESAKAMRSRPSSSPAVNRAALDKANAYDDLLTAPLSPMLDNLVAAHRGLDEALNGDGEVSVEEVFRRFEEIKAQAEQIAKIAKDISDALKPETT
jgi:hypothetical protein